MAALLARQTDLLIKLVIKRRKIIKRVQCTVEGVRQKPFIKQNTRLPLMQRICCLSLFIYFTIGLIYYNQFEVINLSTGSILKF